MSVDMTKWCEIAKANMGKRPAGEGRLGGKICIVTGAAQGFGKGIAEELYKEGATIVIADMNEPLAKQVAAEMGERAVAIAAFQPYVGHAAVAYPSDRPGTAAGCPARPASG